MVACGASAAAAAKFVFDIHVNEANGVSGFAPFSFQQTWAFEANPITGAIGSDLIQRSTSPAVHTPSPLTASALGTLGLDDYGGPSIAFARTRTTFDSGVPTKTHGIATFFREINKEVDLGDGTSSVKFYSMSISDFGDLPGLATGPMNAAGLAHVLQALGPLRFFEGGDHSIVDHDTSVYRQQVGFFYQGTATFNRAESVVPEPGAWALIVLGFGGVGAALRHRRGPMPAV